MELSDIKKNQLSQVFNDFMWNISDMTQTKGICEGEVLVGVKDEYRAPACRSPVQRCPADRAHCKAQGWILLIHPHLTSKFLKLQTWRQSNVCLWNQKMIFAQVPIYDLEFARSVCPSPPPSSEAIYYQDRPTGKVNDLQTKKNI